MDFGLELFYFLWFCSLTKKFVYFPKWISWALLAKWPFPQTQNKYYLCRQLISPFLSVFINCITDVIYVISFRFQPAEGEWGITGSPFVGPLEEASTPILCRLSGPTVFTSVEPTSVNVQNRSPQNSAFGLVLSPGRQPSSFHCPPSAFLRICLQHRPCLRLAAWTRQRNWQTSALQPLIFVVQPWL